MHRHCWQLLLLLMLLLWRRLWPLVMVHLRDALML